jgi:hypothetical protein
LDHRNTYVFQASSDGCTSPQYEFWLRYPSGKWVLMQPFSPSAIFSWDSTGAPAASYSIHVWANQVGDSTASYEGVGELNFSLSAPVPCDSAAIGPLNPSQPAGSVFGFVASSTGCQAPMFQYWYQPPGGTWKIGRPFNEDPTWDWDTTGLKPGTYNVRVWANQQGDSTAAAEASADAVATMIGCDGAAVTPDVASQPAGSPVSLSATSTGCPDPTYEFWTQMPTGTWVMLRGWGGPDFDWSTAGLAPGKYTFHVWSNEQGGNTGTYDVFGVSTITLTGCTSSSVTPASGSSHVGASVTFTANAVGCPTPVFEFWLQDTLGKWHRMTGFAGSTWTWNTTGWAKGTYHLHVWANQQDAYTGTYEVYAAATYTLT